jgi:cullin 3
LNETQIPEKDAKRALIALSSGKQIILNRVGNSDDIGFLNFFKDVLKQLKFLEKTDEFSVNDQFQSKLARIKITYVAARPDVEPERETRAKVEDDRKHEIEAAIVRVLKARKKITHIDLITEVCLWYSTVFNNFVQVTNQLKHRFMPDPMLIKKVHTNYKIILNFCFSSASNL